jgi:hypothetical protein
MLSPLSSLHRVDESPIPASNIVTSPSTFFLVFLRLVYQADDIYRLEVECEFVPAFENVFPCICMYVLQSFHIKENN